MSCVIVYKHYKNTYVCIECKYLHKINAEATSCSIKLCTTRDGLFFVFYRTISDGKLVIKENYLCKVEKYDFKWVIK